MPRGIPDWRRTDEVTFHQTGRQTDAEAMQPPAVVECWIDRDNPRRLVLLVPFDGSRAASGAGDLERGERARATVVETKRLDRTAPGSGHPIYVFALDIESEGRAWRVAYGQRVPPGAERFTEAGAVVEVAYTAVGDSEAVAVDWAATTGGELS